MQELAKDRKDQLDKRVDDRRTYNHRAMLLINDPQGYAEKIYRMLVKSNEKFETKIMLMNYLSRLISCHQLVLLDFYSLMLKYMQPHQQRTDLNYQFQMLCSDFTNSFAQMWLKLWLLRHNHVILWLALMQLNH